MPERGKRRRDGGELACDGGEVAEVAGHLPEASCIGQAEIRCGSGGGITHVRKERVEEERSAS
jgi:hypothetical protein